MEPGVRLCRLVTSIAFSCKQPDGRGLVPKSSYCSYRGWEEGRRQPRVFEKLLQALWATALAIVNFERYTETWEGAAKTGLISKVFSCTFPLLNLTGYFWAPSKGIKQKLTVLAAPRLLLALMKVTKNVPAAQDSS